MMICISGYTGSGKTTVGAELAKDLGLKHVNHSYKDYVKQHADVIKFKRQSDPKFVKQFDREIVLEARKSKNCVVTSWLGPWMLREASVKVWLNASLDVRAKRVCKHVNLSVKETRNYITKKDRLNKLYWKKIYGVDLEDHSNFDIEINTENFTTKQVVAIIAAVSIEKDKKKFE